MRFLDFFWQKKSANFASIHISNSQMPSAKCFDSSVILMPSWACSLLSAEGRRGRKTIVIFHQWAPKCFGFACIFFFSFSTSKFWELKMFEYLTNNVCLLERAGVMLQTCWQSFSEVFLKSPFFQIRFCEKKFS